MNPSEELRSQTDIERELNSLGVTPEEFRATIEKEIRRRRRAEFLLSNPFLFNKELLCPPEKRAFLRPFHERGLEFVNGGHRRKKLILWPRGHLKSTIFTQVETTRRALANPNIRILINSSTWEMAKTFLGAIKGYFLNPEVTDLFGEQLPNTRSGKYYKNNETELTLLSRRDKSLKEPTFTVSGLDKTKTSQHYDLIVHDDIVVRENVGSFDTMDRVWKLWQDSLDLLEPNGEMWLIGCMAGPTKVQMHDHSFKRIDSINEGDYVIDALGQRRRVNAVMDQGVQKTITIRTKRNEFTVTVRHPFMVADRFPNKPYLRNFRWKSAEELQEGDILVSKHFGGSRHDRTNEEMWFLGIMLGDGWVTNRRIVCVATGVHEDINERIRSFMAKWGKVTKTKFGYFRIDSRPFAEWILSQEFKGNARTKRIPSWVYDCSNANELLNGLYDSDGYLNNGQLCFELCNKDLVEDIKHLGIVLGHKTSNIYTRSRLSQPPCSPKPVLATSHHISIGSKTSSIWGESITHIETSGESRVWDLTVDGGVFLANGVVTHNTRWHPLDVYGRVMSDLCDERCARNGWVHVPDCTCDFDVSILQLKDENDKFIFDSKFDDEIADALLRQKGRVEFSCQYLNSPSDPGTVWFPHDQLERAKISPEEIERLRSKLVWYMATDPAESLEQRASYTACVGVGVDHETGIWYVDYAKQARVDTPGFIELVFGSRHAVRPHKFGMELSTRKALGYVIKDSMAQRNEFFTIDELKPMLGNTPHAKEVRIKRLKPLFEFGRIRINSTLHDLWNILYTLPAATTWDLVDALSYVMDMVPEGLGASRVIPANMPIKVLQNGSYGYAVRKPAVRCNGRIKRPLFRRGFYQALRVR